MSHIKKLRYHLGRGPNYMKWQVINTATREVRYYDTQDFSLFIENGKLNNIRLIADKIFCGENKDVCSWISFQKSTKNPGNIPSDLVELSYNPRNNPFWVALEYEGVDFDNFCGSIYIRGRRLYTTRDEAESFVESKACFQL